MLRITRLPVRETTSLLKHIHLVPFESSSSRKGVNVIKEILDRQCFLNWTKWHFFVVWGIMSVSKFSEKNPGNFMFMMWINRNLKIYYSMCILHKFKKSCIQNSQTASKKNWKFVSNQHLYDLIYKWLKRSGHHEKLSLWTQPPSFPKLSWQYLPHKSGGEVATLLKEETIWALPKYLFDCSSVFIKIGKFTYDVHRTDW